MSPTLHAINVTHPILAIDHGEARIGLAATDPLGIAAHPLETIDVRSVNPLGRIAEIVRERSVKRILLGLPLRLDGTEGSAARKVRAFGAQLALRLPGVPLEFSDERLSTVAAAEKLRAAGRSARRQKLIIDQVAALEILTDWLAEHNPP